MTKEEAIKVLEMFLYKQCDLARTEFAYDANTVWEAVNMASKALEQEPCDDAISRQTAIKNVAQIAKAVAKSDKQKSLCGRIIFMLEHQNSIYRESEG